MKLNSAQVEQTLNQMNAQVVPNSHPALTQLTDMFGEHTFFLDQGGLKVLEPSDVPQTDGQAGEVVSLADWSDSSLTSLAPHPPVSTGTIIVLREVKH
jgi:hypothetical protein